MGKTEKDSNKYSLVALQMNYKFDTNTEANPNNVARTLEEWTAWRSDMLNAYYSANNGVKSIAWILHDKDVQIDTANNGQPVTDDDGNVIYKPAHIHALIEFSPKKRKRVSTIMKYFNITYDKNCQGVNTKVTPKASPYRYLMHISEQALTEPNKHIYGFDEVHVIGDLDYKEALSITTKADALRFITGIQHAFDIEMSTESSKHLTGDVLNDVLGGDLIGQFYTEVLVEVAEGNKTLAQAEEFAKSFIHEKLAEEYRNDGSRKYDDDLIKRLRWVFLNRYMGKFEQAENDYLRQRSAYLTGDVKDKPLDINLSELDDPEDRNLTNLYISGPAGTGKSQLAKYLALEMDTLGRGVHTAPAPSPGKTFDFTNTYHGEDVTVFNDIDAGAFAYREFFNVFDAHQSAPVSSRNNDRNWFAHFSILTNSIPLHTFLDDMIKFSKGGSKYFAKDSESDKWYIRKEELDELNDLRVQGMRRITFYIETKPHKTGTGSEYYLYTYHKYNPATDNDELMDYAGHWLTRVYDCKDVTSADEVRKVAKQIGDDMKQYMAVRQAKKDAYAFGFDTKPCKLLNAIQGGAEYGYKVYDKQMFKRIEEVTEDTLGGNADD